MSLRLGTVGHFGIAVHDPKKSARWWIKTLNVRKRFDFPGGVVVGSDAVDIVLLKGMPHPEVLDHVSFHLPSMQALRDALTELKRKHVVLEDPDDEIGPEGPGSKNMGLWFHDPDGYRWELSVLAKPKPRRKRR
jgi:catechol 2,3-dioxygenase-like lactoylglutathione lyase family enzyme